MGFLPVDYQAPERTSGGQYFKPKDGANRIRLLSSPIVGYSYWTPDNKPKRSKQHPGNPSDRRLNDQGKPDPIKFFWALIIWDYGSQQVCIWEFTQGSIQRAIENLNDSDEWGDPREYDLTIKRSGTGLETEYAVIPSPPKAVAADIKAAYEACGINLTALFRGENPFAGNSESGNRSGSFDGSDDPGNYEYVSQPVYTELWKTAKKNGWTEKSAKGALEELGIDSLRQIPIDKLEAVEELFSQPYEIPF